MRRNAGAGSARIRSKARGRCVLAAGLWLGLTAAAAAADETKTFRDWMAGCDNVRTCTAISLPPDAVETVAYLRLERPAGPDGAPQLLLRLRGDWKKPPAALQLKLDGAAFPAGGKPLPATADGDVVTVTFSAEDTTTLIAAARKATKLTAAAPGVAESVSLAGAVAAMLWIDEQQGRLGTATALIRKGDKTDVPPAPALPLVAAVPTPPMLDTKVLKQRAASLRAELKKRAPDGCEDDSADGDEAWALGDKRVLVALACSRGAYNLSSSFFIMPENEPAKATPLRFADGDGDDGNELTNASFDPRTGHLAFFAKGRGIADCGTSGGYAWTGKDFVRTESAMMGECRGIAPEDWITLYRSKVK